jgi:CMP-N-acetylneuraminic acid synthetase
MTKRSLITICARGGSKGVKDKHVRELNGKPLLWYTLEHAKAWGKAKVVVSSDSHRILALVPQWANPIRRPDELAQDDTPKVPVIRHAWREAERMFGTQFDTVIDLDASAPLRTVADIEGCYQTFLELNCLTLFSVCDGPNPRFNMVEWKDDGKLDLCIPKDYWDKGIRCRQGISRVAYSVNSNIYIYSRNFLENKLFDSCLVPRRTGVYQMHKRSLIHVDSEEDWETVEDIMRGMKK